MTEGEEPDLCRMLYRSMRLIRRVEEEIARVYPTDVIKSPIHLSIGQEAAAVGICGALRQDDVVSATYRGHAAYLAKGGDLRALIAELYGKATGCARGKGGSMHIIDMGQHILGTSAVVGTTIPIAVGYAWASKQEGRQRVVVTFFGDGATEEGVFSESLNFAALHKLPIFFVCENNFYAIHTPLAKRWATRRLCERVETYGIPAEMIQDGDVFRIRTAATAAIDKIRAGHGPAFLEIHSYRWRGHVGPSEDYAAGYRSYAEAERWMRDDQVTRLGSLLDSSDREMIDGAIEEEIADAFHFAELSPFPETADLYRDVYGD
jgi:pyruvate dehydrogenase E1 component alpha subunit